MVAVPLAVEGDTFVTHAGTPVTDHAQAAVTASVKLPAPPALPNAALGAESVGAQLVAKIPVTVSGRSTILDCGFVVPVRSPLQLANMKPPFAVAENDWLVPALT